MASTIPGISRPQAERPFSTPSAQRVASSWNGSEQRVGGLVSASISIPTIEFEIPADLVNRKIYCAIVGFAGGFGAPDAAGDSVQPRIRGKLSLLDQNRPVWEFPIFHGPDFVNTDIGITDDVLRGGIPPFAVMPAIVTDSIFPKINQLSIGSEALIFSSFPMQRETILIPPNIQPVTVVAYPMRISASANKCRIDVWASTSVAVAISLHVILGVMSSNSDF